jgi:hypothetical protein
MRSALALTALLAIAIAVPAHADVIVSGSGIWAGDNELHNDFNKIGDSWSFSFELPNPTAADTTDITNAEFDHNGSPVSEMLDEVVFYNSGSGGFFDLIFDDGTVLSFFGASSTTDIGSTGTITTGGPYDVNVAFDGSGNFSGSGTVSVAEATTTAPAPEPATLALLGAGLAGLSRIRRRKTAA